MDNFNHIISNTIGTVAAEIITLPICTLKTIYQTQSNKKLSIKNTMKKIYQDRGLRGFYDAKFSAITSQTLSTVSKYGFYQTIKNYRNTQQNDLLNNAINGCTGGILGSIISHPVDVLKNYNQRGDKKYFIDMKKNIIKTMYKGYSQTILKNILLYSSIYPLYDFYKSKISDKSYIVAPLTTLTVTMYLQPIDYLKVNLMAGNKVNFNISELYKGTSLHLMRSIPHFMITMLITEFIFNKFNN
jgi:hypothetical protein